MTVCRISGKPWAMGRNFMPVVDPSASRRVRDATCMVYIGRRYLWGLGAFGQEGVERVLELMRAQFELAMRQCGVRSVKELSPALVRRT
jgi:4-hydroxymandelate oxidase